MRTRADFLRVSFGREEREKWPKSSRPRGPPRIASLLAAAHAGEQLKLQQAPGRVRILLSYIFRLSARDSRRIIASGEHARTVQSRTFGFCGRRVTRTSVRE